MSEGKRNIAVFSAIVLLLSVLGTLVMAEIGLRVAEKAGLYPGFFELLGKARPPLDRRTGPGMYYAHPYSAYAMKPNYQREPFEKINSFGLRGEDISAEKPADVYRIIAIGGSTTFAVYLPWNESYPYYLQQELRKRFNTDRIEVINAGLTGSTTAESYHRLATQILPLNPDMVIVYHAFNDLLPRVFSDYQEDYYHFRRSDPNNPPGMTRFYLYRFALGVLSPGFFHENYNLMSTVWKVENLPNTDTERSQNFIDSSNDAFRFNLDNIIQLLRAKDVDVVLASFAMNLGIWHWMDNIPPYLWEVGIAENNEAIYELASEHGLPIVPFAEAPFIAGSKDFGEAMFSDSIHMSPGGNQFKAAIFADTVAPIVAKSMGVPAPRPSKYAAGPAMPETPVDGIDEKLQ